MTVRIALPLFLVLMLLTLGTMPAMAAKAAKAENSFASAGEAGQWIVEYYQNPEPGRLADAVKVLSENEGISEDGQKILVSFIGAALVEASPKERDAFFKAIGDHEKAKFFALPSFWFMNSEAGRALIKRAEKEWKEEGVVSLAKQLESADSPDLLAMPLQNRLHLDHLWSMFFANGKPEPVLKIISALSLIGNEKVEKHLTGQSAQYSLRVNARVHPRVREIMETALKAMTGPLKGRLAKTLKQ